MKLSFSQGLARYQTDINATPAFLQRSSQDGGEFIDLIVSPDPTVIIFAHQGANYVVEESRTVPNAWGPFPQTGTSYLYWDVNLLDAGLTRGFTSRPLITTSTSPTNPGIDQHWFDTAQRLMKVWNGQKWLDKVRVFAGTFSSQGIIQPSGLGSQVGLTGNFEAGALILDAFNKPLRQSDGTFLTSATNLSIINAATQKVRFETEIINGMAEENIPQFSFVQIKAHGRLALARSDNWRSRIAGLVTEDLYQSEIGSLTSAGLVRNEQWSWSSEQVGRPVFCGSAGQITLTPPTRGVNQIAGYVYDSDLIWLNIQDVTILDDLTVPEPAPAPPPAPIADFYANPVNGVSPLTVTFTSTSLHNPRTYQWDIGNNGTIDGDTSVLTYTFVSPGTYAVRLKVSNEFGQHEVTKTALITVQAPDLGSLKTNLGIQLGAPAQVVKNQNFNISIIISNDGHRGATFVTRVLTFTHSHPDTPSLIFTVTGVSSNQVTVNDNKLIVTLPVLASLESGGIVTQLLTIASNKTGTIDLHAVVQSPESDVTTSDNSADLVVRVLSS